MKAKKAIVAATLILASATLFFGGCKKKGQNETPAPADHTAETRWVIGETEHWHACTACNEHVYDKAAHTFTDKNGKKQCSVCLAETDYTQEENALLWLEGRDATLAYRGDYTIYSVEESDENNEKYKSVRKESWGGTGKYLYRTETYGAEKGKDYIQKSSSLKVLKVVSDEGKEKTKYYTCDTDATGNEQKLGSFVKPAYITEDDLYYRPDTLLDDYGIETGNDYETLIAGIRAFGESEVGKQPDEILFTRREDGSVTLSIRFSFTGSDTVGETNEPVTYSVENSLFLTAKDGKITEAKDWLSETVTYEKQSKTETGKTTRSKTFSYEFDETEHAAADVTTDETTNSYYADVFVNFAGSDTCFLYNGTLVGEPLTAESISWYVDGYFALHESSRKLQYELYLDENCTKPLTEFLLERDNYNVWLKFTVPEGRSLVLIAFRDKTGKNILRFINMPLPGSETDTKESFSHYRLLSFNGKEVSENISFVCEEGKAYVLIFDEQYME